MNRSKNLQGIAVPTDCVFLLSPLFLVQTYRRNLESDIYQIVLDTVADFVLKKRKTIKMLYTEKMKGTVAEVVNRLNQAVKDNNFGILDTIDLAAKMQEKGISFNRDCVILEVCNPQQAKQVLDENMAVSTSLPCRISVYEEDGETTVATLRPTVLIGMYGKSDSLAAVAQQVENAVIKIIREAR